MGKVVSLPNNWRPRPYQMPLWTYLENGGKRAVEVAHRRWGKDDLTLHRTCVAAFERPATYWHMLPEYSQARKAIWSAVNPHTGKRRIDEAFPHELRASAREDTMSITFKNGSTWQVVGSDAFDGLVGSPPAGLVFSEYAIANPAAWGYLRPILLENGGWAVFIYTARGRNHGHSLLESAKREPGWFHETSTALSTGVFTAEQLESERRQYIAEFGETFGAALFDQEYLCSFDAAIVGAFYGPEINAAEADGRICDVPIDETAPLYSAWDLGVRDATALWIFQPTYGGINVVDFYKSSGVGADHYRDWMREKGYQTAVDFVPHDSRVREWGSGRTRIETMLSLNLKPQLVPDHRLMDGINAARETIRVARFDATRCKDGIEALRQYRSDYDREARVLKATPLHDWTSDPADAFRYMAMSWRQLKAPAPELAPPKFAFIAGPDGVRSGPTFSEIVARRTARRMGEAA